jgi:hypothetical protein
MLHTILKHRSAKPDIGLVPIYSPLNHTADVIFVHGLMGHRSHTWETKSGNFWLEWLGGCLPQTRVWSYGYNAQTVAGSQDVFHIYATQFLEEMSRHLSVHTYIFYYSLCTYTDIKPNI